ncbi:40S ribosomal protein S17-B, putative [Trichomonas vaginalis G3]|uniref:40S ribosomal protein S17-B, putative n=1 Tax=Trichomonas vaginalis (strain ATCC PRA-98 / G3) TaxID=412133 RepID=A2DQS7_TRIV3|nr:ribosomal small subunit assembly [Trichomonas vaginalis G3]EAY17194.1 40S ribosomal protein S17-B, putative [Trichomonas vaginalis G3]KAI5486274.1 ribosomal small subunit assembly [Trichomonas vaginalis G3]|eukprot:XP_001329417.1 40S ribosomal protein S17-B [Trichomonas vaginalis G3]
MGRIRTKTTKRAARLVIERFYGQLSFDFQDNKRVCDAVADIPSKRMRNKIAGYVTHLMRRLERGPVRGISFKLQEQEREKRDNWMPTTSKLNVPKILVDPETKEMLAAIGLGEMEGVEVFIRRAGARQQ